MASFVCVNVGAAAAMFGVSEIGKFASVIGDL